MVGAVVAAGVLCGGAGLWEAAGACAGGDEAPEDPCGGGLGLGLGLLGGGGETGGGELGLEP